MVELFKLLGTIAIDNSEAMGALDETSNRASKIPAVFEKIGSAAIAVGKTVAVGLAAGSAAIGALTKDALGNYADYEQLVGGVETLFKESAERVLAYADIAYKTAGLSANDYMETVTSFSASLISSLENDTEAAAEKANKAIVDMSDNANKMGSSMESIQNAYQGFAKQNYTMLDNLKLGYGGTKEEMSRLLRDATAISGIEYDVSSYADIIDAIHVIQEELGIAGTTAKEASSTISGSISSMKSAWENLVTGIGDENADLSGLIDDFVVSLSTAADNVSKRVVMIASRIPEMLSVLIPKITEMLPGLLTTLLPALIDGAVMLLNGIVAVLPSVIQIILEQMPYIVTQLGAGLAAAFPILLDVAQQLFGQLWDYISLNLLNTGVSFEDMLTNLGVLWATFGQPVLDIIMGAIGWVSENWATITTGMTTEFQVLWDMCKTAWDTFGQPIWDMISFAVLSAFDLFAANMPAILTFFSDAIAGIKDTWENHLKPVFDYIKFWLTEIIKPTFEYVWKTIVLPLIEYVFQTIGSLWNNTLKPVFDAICNFLTGAFTGDWRKMKDSVLTIIESLEAGLEAVFGGLETFLTDVGSNIGADMSKCWNKIKSDITSKVTTVENTVKNTFNRIKDSIVDKLEIAKDKVKGAIDKIKGFFNFSWSLPSLKMPHPYISGKFSLDPPQVPSFGISWYKKAMNDPIIMDSPTAFGINNLGQIMAGGEAGSEVVSGTETLMNMIASAVAAKNEKLEALLQNILAYMMEMMPQMANMQMVTDTGALIGEIAPGIDEALGILAQEKGV